MKITLYFINYNDSYYFPFIKKHYGDFCQRIVLCDNYSSDESIDLAQRLGFDVRMFGYRGELNDQSYLDLKNHVWKEERGKSDYVIVCDADEFLMPDILKGTAPKVRGYDMISDTLPEHDIFEIKTGEESENYSKQIVFSPTHIDEINFVHGCHKNNKTGQINDSGFCRLFHYRCIGGVDRLIDRHKMYRQRMSKFNLMFNMGHHYLQEEEQKRIEWNLKMKTARELW